jgi:tRNA 2-thiouridine synthesizing protein B
MILHILSASPSSAAFRDCIALLQPGDAVLLMGDGVYAALAGTPACNELLGTGVEIHVLQNDAAAAGVPLPTGSIAITDMDGFVTLTERFSRQLSWY